MPEDLFERPANGFVGRFIGSPPMNLVEASMEEDGGVLWLVIGGSRLRLPEEKARSVRKSEQREILLGIRPGDVHAAEGNRDNSLRALITQVEPLGGESLVHASVDGLEISFLSRNDNGKKPTVESPVQLSLDLAKAHFFEKGGIQKTLES
jgi:multiple sugar transport system ATP-binding protein